MLAWEFFIHREDRDNPGQERGPILAAWRSHPSGISWLQELAEDNLIENLGGNGYPCRFHAQAKYILPILKAGVPPQHKRPEYFRSENRLPKSWNGELMINGIELSRCLETDYLLIEAWDQS